MFAFGFVGSILFIAVLCSSAFRKHHCRARIACFTLKHRSVPGHGERQPLPFFLHLFELRACPAKLQCPILTCTCSCVQCKCKVRMQMPSQPSRKTNQSQRFPQDSPCNDRALHPRQTWLSSCRPTAFLGEWSPLYIPLFHSLSACNQQRLSSMHSSSMMRIHASLCSVLFAMQHICTWQHNQSNLFCSSDRQ